MIIKGNDITIYADGEAVAASKQCTVTIQSDTMEKSGAQQGKFREYLASRKEWSVSTNYLVRASSSALKDIFGRVGVVYSIRIGRRGSRNDAMTGDAICTSASVTATRGSLATGKFEFKGTGALSAPARIRTFDNTFGKTFD